MRKPARDAVAVVAVFLVAAAALIGWLYSLGAIPEGPDWQLPGVRAALIVMGLSFLLMVGLNLWEIKRNDFRWHRDPVAALVILVLLWLIIWPVYSSALTSAAHARMNHARHQQR
jgi:uncharacterized membrane protein YozB (DUF420 family)